MSNNASFEGLSSLSSTTLSSTPEPFTLEDIQRAFDMILSEEYQQREAEQQRFAAKGVVLLTKAYQQGILSEAEYMHLFSTIALNGGLIVSPPMKKRLEQVEL